MSLRCYFQNIYDIDTQKYEKFDFNFQFNLMSKRFIRCGSCFNCKKMKAVEWTNKAKFEMREWKYAYFITLTYNNQNVPLELNTRDYQLFLKRFRKWLAKYHNKERLRYMIAGEYGSMYMRPHYHLIVFMNVDLKDSFYRVAKKQFSSKLIESFWKLGFITIAPATLDTIAYTAFYSTKKLTKSEKFSFLRKYSRDGLVHKNEFIYASNGFGQKYVRDNIGFFMEHWKMLPKSLIKESIFGDDFVKDVKEQKQELMLSLHQSIDWRKQRLEYQEIEQRQKEIIAKKRLLKYR